MRRFTQSSPIRAALSAMTFLLAWVPSLGAQNGLIITGLQVTVAPDDSVTVHNTGTTVFPNQTSGSTVGDAGTYPYVNGWGHVSGTIEWLDGNGSLAMRLDSNGVEVPVDDRVANSNGSKSGSVQLSGSSVLGASLRATYGVGTRQFVSTVVVGSGIDFDVSGTLSVDPSDLTVQSPSVIRTTLATGQSFRVSARVANQGVAPSSSATTLRFYSSIDSAISTGDSELGSTGVPRLQVGGQTPALSILVNAPLAEGTYWIGACVDAVPNESDTGNQCSIGIEVTVILDNDLDGIPDAQDPDDDNDGMPDDWENQHAGLDPFVYDADIDQDFDDLANGAEYAAGTDPNDPDSDNDDIIDGLDRLPNLPSNDCFGADVAFGPDVVAGPVTCAASGSITVIGVEVQGGDLELMAPEVRFFVAFSTDDQSVVTVRTVDPTPP